MDVEPYDHLRAPDEGGYAAGARDTGVDDAADAHEDAALAPGVYRVVGVDDGAATLLRVTDADGRRVRSGHVERVDESAVAAMEPAENPDASAGPLRALASLAQGLFWSVRGTLRRLVP